MLKQKIAAGILGLAMVLPMIASADATTDAQNKIKTLLDQIKTIQEQIRTIVGTNAPAWHPVSTSTPQGGGNGPCFVPMRSFGMGAKGDDVKNLQEWLRGENEDGFTGVATGFFGPATAKALARWQQRNGISSSTSGTVGPRTQDFLKKRCGGEGKDDRGMMMNMSARIMGSITTTNGNDISVVNGDGKIVVVHVTATTTIKVWNATTTPATTGSLSNLIVGKKIAADGLKDTDGGITAVHITVGAILPPMGMSGMMGGNGGNDGKNNENDNFTHGTMGDMMGGNR